MAEVILQQVSKTYDNDVVAVNNIDLTISDGEFVVLVGPSGCGKSTTLRMIAGLEKVTSGSISIGGTDVTHFPARQRNIAMVFQDYALYPHLSVAANLGFGLQRRRTYGSSIRGLTSVSYRKAKAIEQKTIHDRVQQIAELLGLTEVLQRKSQALSGGQRQRVALGRAIVRDPAVFLLDEPLSNLDAKLRRAMRLELRALHKRLGATMVHVTHDQEEAMTLGDMLAVMHEGVIRQFDSPTTIYDSPADRFVASFVGVPEMNFIEGTFNASDGVTSFTSTSLQLEIPSHCIPITQKRDVVMGIRAEDITISSQGSKAIVSTIERHGDHTDVYIDVAGTPLTVRTQGSFAHQEGQEVSYIMNPAKVHFFDCEGDNKRLPTH